MALLPDTTGPVTVLFTPRDLPIFRDGMTRLYPLPASFFDRPCWVHRLGTHTDGEIFRVLPEGPVDPEIHPHFWAMLTDVVGVMTHDDVLRRRILDAEGHGKITLGYHATGEFAPVRDYFRKRGPIVEARELVRGAFDPPAPSEEDTLRMVDAIVRVSERSSSERVALRDYLHGGGSDAPPMPRRNAPRLERLFVGLTPRVFNAAHMRALDVLTTSSDYLAPLERELSFASPVHDLHYLWREMLGARGFSDDAIEQGVVEAWAIGDVVSPRAWWVLDRAARDPGAFLARYSYSRYRQMIHRRLLYGAWITWDLPRFHALAEELVAKHGRRLDAEAILGIVQCKDPTRSRALLMKHRDEILVGRRGRDRQRLINASEGAGEP